MKKIVTLIALLTFFSTSFVFSNGNKEEAMDGPLTVSMLYADNASYPLQKDWLVLSEMEKASGVKLDIQPVPDGDYRQKFQIVLASGNVPDIVNSKAPALSQDVIDGLLLPISDYFDQMPNLTKFLADNNYEADMERLTEGDGKIYSLPVKANTKRIVIHQWLVRKDIFEKHNIPLPKTMDDVLEAGIKLKALYPDSTPITNRFGSGNVMSVMGSAWGTKSGWSLDSNGQVYNEDKDEWVYAPTSDEFREMLKWTNKLIVNGVLDEEFTSLDSTVYEQRVTQSETFIMVDWVGNQVRYNNEGKKSNPDFNVQPIMPPQGPNGDYATDRGSLYEQWWVFPSSLADDPRVAEKIAYIDWFYSDEAEIITTFGKEGESYIVNDEGRLEYKDLSIDFSVEYGLQNNALNARRHPDFFRAFNGKEIDDLFTEMDKVGAVKSQDPKIVYTEDELTDLQLIIPPVNDYFSSMFEKFIYGYESLDDANWNKFVKECEAKGSIELTNIVNNAWQRTNK